MRKLALTTLPLVLGFLITRPGPTASADTLQSCGNEYAIQSYNDFVCTDPSFVGGLDAADELVGKDCQTMQSDGSLRACTYRWYEHYDISVGPGCTPLSNPYWVYNWGVTTDCN